MSTNTNARIAVKPDPEITSLFAVYVNDVVVKKTRFMTKGEATGYAVEMRRMQRKNSRERWQPKHLRPTPIIPNPPMTPEQKMAMQMAERDAARKERRTLALEAKRRR